MKTYANLKRILALPVLVATLSGCPGPVDPKPDPVPVISVSGLEGKLNDNTADIFSDEKSIDCTVSVTDGTLDSVTWYDNENNSGSASYGSGKVLISGEPNYGPLSLKFVSDSVEKSVTGLVYSPTSGYITSVLTGGSGDDMGLYTSGDIDSWFSDSLVSSYKDAVKNSKAFFYGFVDKDSDGSFDSNEYGLIHILNQDDSISQERITKEQVDYLNANNPYP